MTVQIKELLEVRMFSTLDRGFECNTANQSMKEV